MTARLFSVARFRAAFRHFVVGRVAQAVSTLAVTLLAVRLLEGADYGVYMVAWGLVELAVPLTSLGLLPAAQRFLPELAERGTPAALSRFLRQVGLARWALIGLAALLLALGWPRIAPWLGASGTAAALGGAVAALVALNLMARFTAELLEALLDQKYAQTARALLPLLRIAGLLGLWASQQLTLPALIWVDAAAAGVAWLLAEYWLRRRVCTLRPDGDHVVDAAALRTFVWHMSGTQLLNALANAGLLRLIVARQLGLEAAGHFGFLQQLIVIGQRYLPSTLLANLIRPMLIARHADGQARDVAVAFGFLWKLNLMLVWPLLPLALLAGDALVSLLSGARVPQGGLPLALLLFGMAATAQNQIVVMAMQVYRYTALSRRVSLLAILAPGLAWVGAGGGLPGVAAGIALALGLRGSIGLASLRRQPLNAALDWPGVGRFLLALGVAVAAAWAARLAWGPLPAAAVLLAAVLAGTRLARPLTAVEAELVARALGRRARGLAAWARG